MSSRAALRRRSWGVLVDEKLDARRQRAPALGAAFEQERPAGRRREAPSAAAAAANAPSPAVRAARTAQGRAPLTALSATERSAAPRRAADCAPPRDTAPPSSRAPDHTAPPSFSPFTTPHSSRGRCTVPGGTAIPGRCAERREQAPGPTPAPKNPFNIKSSHRGRIRY